MTSLADAMAARIPHGLDAGFPLDGLEQRAQVLTAVREDLHGARTAVRRGALPQCVAERLLALPDCSPKRFYAADLVSCPDGVWRVARDRTAGSSAPGALDAPVLAAFLPALSRALLGEDLLLPSLPAWWLSDPGVPARLTDKAPRWSVRDGFDPAPPPIRLAGLSTLERIALQARLDTAPERFVLVLNLDLAVTTLLWDGFGTASISSN